MYLFLDKYCKVTANLEYGETNLTGWIISADAETILLLDEQDNETTIAREQLVGSIVVLEGQKVKTCVEIDNYLLRST